MIKIKPFKAIRPNKVHSKELPTLNKSSYSKDEINQEKDHNSFMSIINNDTERIRQELDDFIENKLYEKEKSSYFYIYRQENESGQSYTGIVSIVGLQDYLDGKIKPHESISQKRHSVFSNYLNKVEFQAEPILLSFQDNNKTNQIISIETKSSPEYEFEKGGSTHSLWVIKNRLNLKQLIEVFGKVNTLHIIDGHHRMESSLKYMLDKKKQNGDEHMGIENYNYVMAMLVPDSQIEINEFNRVLKDINGLSKDDFVEKISKYYRIINKGSHSYFPSHKYHLSMYLEDEFYGLYLKYEYRESGVVEGTDVCTFNKYILGEILGFDSEAIKEKVSCVKGYGGIKSSKKIRELVDSDDSLKAGFVFHPLTVNELKDISDSDCVLPKKTTYIKPKLLSGLTIFDTKDDF